MFNHGLTAATLFWFMALLERRSGGLRGLDDFGGLAQGGAGVCRADGHCAVLVAGAAGTEWVCGRVFDFQGAFPLAAWATSLSVLGLLVTAIFILSILQRVFSGPLNERWCGFADLTRERVALAPAIALMFMLGLFRNCLA